MTRFHTLVTAVALATLPLTGALAQTKTAKPDAQPKQPGYQSTPAPAGGPGIRQVEDPDRLAYWRGSKIIGENVKDANGKGIGKIEDLMLDDSGRISFAVLSFGGFLGIGDKLYAVPWNAMRFDRDGHTLKAIVLDVTKEYLEKAPSFARDRWPGENDRQWGTESRRYWSDAAITGQVKTRLASQKLGTLAKVDVDTRQGVVQLNGTVDSEQTKRRASDVARRVDGVKNVVNNLKVQAGG